MNIILGLVMFGVALDLRRDDFVQLLRSPRAAAVGLLCQFLLLPAIAWSFSRFASPSPSFALGLILVAACPGGNVSNAFTHLAGGRTTTSVGMTAVSTLVCLVSLPLNMAFWGSLSDDTAALLRAVAPDPLDMLSSVAVLLAIPIALGTSFARWLPSVAARLRRPFKWFSILAFGAFIVIAFAKNLDVFSTYAAVTFPPVIALNAIALTLGYGGAWVAGLDEADRRAVSIEVGIQNAGLGLVLVFAVFDGLGGMALAAAGWGLWHLVSGLGLALWWGRTAERAVGLGHPSG